MRPLESFSNAYQLDLHSLQGRNPCGIIFCIFFFGKKLELKSARGRGGGGNRGTFEEAYRQIWTCEDSARPKQEPQVVTSQPKWNFSWAHILYKHDLENCTDRSHSVVRHTLVHTFDLRKGMPLSHSPSSSLSVLLPFVVDQHAKNIMVKKLLRHKNKHTHTHTHTKRGRFPAKATTHALSFRRNLEEERGVECLWCWRLKGGTHHTSFRELYPTEGVGQERKRLKYFKFQTNVHQSWTQSTIFSCLSCIKHCTYKLNGYAVQSRAIWYL